MIFLNLSIEQEKAIDHVYGPALLLAVPGAGKTTVLIHRIINLIKNHKIEPQRILSITFSKASALDMRKRFSTYFPEVPSNLFHFSTIHSFCYSIIREYAYISKVKFTLIEDDKNQLNKYNLLKKIYFKFNNSYITEEKLETLLNSIGYIKNMMITPKEFLKNNKTDIESFIQIYDFYEEYKRNNNLLDFDDMLTIALEILRNKAYLLDKYRNKYDFIQVDEGQDTSKAQMEIIKLLANSNNNLFIVADDDQSIYGFRGAYPQGLFDFKKNYHNGKLFFMETNYRSSKNIVSICNQFIKINTIRYNKNITTNNEYVEPINIVKVKSIKDQYEYIIKDLEGKDLSNVCILYRNNISSIGIIEAFERRDIPFYVRDVKLRFFNHWLIQDIINFMLLSQDTTNMSLYENIYYKTKGFISKKQINYAKTLDSKISVFDRIMDFPGLSEFYKRTLRELKLDFKKISKLQPKNSIEYIEYHLEYDDYLKENSMKFGYTYDGLKTMLYYLKLIAENTINLDDFFKRLKHLQYLCSNSKNKDNAITLSTIHSAKGLEFERVYIVDLLEGDFPSISSIEALEKGDIESIEEERRLFYVGMTRAKTHLSLITLDTLCEKKVEPSRFLKELSQEL